eukprot:Skav213197  [mRNA]  locus=scaffold2826:295054:297366:+ [translate_table: standard]
MLERSGRTWEVAGALPMPKLADRSQSLTWTFGALSGDEALAMTSAGALYRFRLSLREWQGPWRLNEHVARALTWHGACTSTSGEWILVGTRLKPGIKVWLGFAVQMLCCCTKADGAVADGGLPLKWTASPSDEEIVIRLKSPEDLKRLDLDLTDPKCVILASCNGAAAEWNRQNAKQVLPFDRIVKINGKACEAQDIVSMLKDTGAVELSLERPLKRMVYLKKEGSRLGLDLSFTKVGTGQWKASVKPWIAAIADGLVAEWNANMPELAIGQHDRIISINSKNGPPDELVSVLGTASEAIELEVLHYNF